MNIDLLKKLVRLATNNPNDNEANLAARKVCKMLLKDDFKSIGNGQIKQKNDWEGFKAPESWPDILRNYQRDRERYYKAKKKNCSECGEELGITNLDELYPICGNCRSKRNKDAYWKVTW